MISTSGNIWKFLPLLGIFLLSGCWQDQTECLKFPSSMATLPMENEILVASEKEKKLAVLDACDFKMKKSILLDKVPTGIVCAEKSDFIYVSAGLEDGVVYEIHKRHKRITGEIKVGHSPVSPVLNEDTGFLYVCNRFANTVSLVDLEEGRTMAKIDVIREPVDAVLTADGRFLFVANHLPGQSSAPPPVACKISIIDTKEWKVVVHIQLPDGSIGVQGIALSPEGDYAYITHLIAQYKLPAIQIERGWMNANAFSVIDVKNQKLLNTVLLDEPFEGAANPWGVVCTQDGKYLCISHSGTNEISVIDRAVLHRKLKDPTRYEPFREPSLPAGYDLNFLAGFRKRVKISGITPREIQVAGNSGIFTVSLFSHSLEFLDLEQDPPKVKSIALSRSIGLSSVEKGEMFFSSGLICLQHWQSCTSCHPEGRTDGLNWDLLNDGIGNPKNTRSLLFAHRTPPVMATGARADAKTAVRSGIRFIQFSQQSEEVAESIDSYLKALRPVPSPFLEDGRLSVSAQRGRALFFSIEVGCAGCHPEPHYTDLEIHDVGTHSSLDFTMDQKEGRTPQKRFDTPSLIESWRTAPYLHDGRYTTIWDVIRRGNHMDLRGKTSHLSDRELRDLEMYILSL